MGQNYSMFDQVGPQGSPDKNITDFSNVDRPLLA